MLATQLMLLLHAFESNSHAKADRTPHVHAPTCATTAFTKPQVGPGIQVRSVHAQPQYNFTSIAGGPLQPALDGLDFCQVQIFLSHQIQTGVESENEDEDEKVLVEVWLPLTAEDWNGRLQATGGAAFATGMFGAHLGIAVNNGWAAVSTDGGHDADLARRTDASWATSELGKAQDGNRLRWDLIHNFASRSALDQVVIGKDITRQYFGASPHHSYWNGCSTGGRQGHAIAQKHPEILDGILANAPAINSVNLLMAELWPQFVMKDHNVLLSNCELDHFRSWATSGCQKMEEVKNGILEDPSDCDWGPEEMVGSTIDCAGGAVMITKAMAEVVKKLLDGPDSTFSGPHFPGLPRGSSMTTLANTSISSEGAPSLNPFPIAASFLRYMVTQNASADVAHMNIEAFKSLWISAQYELGGLLNTDNPDLTRLRNPGTKMLTWHGTYDQMIPYQNTVNYRRKVEAVMGGANAVDEYYRLFLAPGVEHCGGGLGPVPQDPLDALVRWVEDNEPPETLDASVIDHEGDAITKELCLWPAKAKYLGIGDPKRASSWTCQGGTERPANVENEAEPWSATEFGAMQGPPEEPGEPNPDDQVSGRAEQIIGGLKDRIEGLGLGFRVE